MNIIYQSKKFKEENVVAQYAQWYSNGEVMFFDVDAKKKTIREYWLAQIDVTNSILQKVVGRHEMVKVK